MKEKSKFRKGLERVLASGIIFFGSLVGGVKASGQLNILNDLNNGSYLNCSHLLNYRPGAQEGYDSHDDEYNPLWWAYTEKSKIVSKVGDYELETDARPQDSNTPVNLELSLHSQSGDPIIVSDLKNELICNIDPGNNGYDFGTKPITLWEQDQNDPNIYHLLANVRKKDLQNEGVVLEDLAGTYESEVPYWKGEVRFDTYYVHLNGDDMVNFGDYAILVGAMGRTGITDANRADPNDKGAWDDFDLDNVVDMNDLCIFTDYWLAGKNYDTANGCYVH